MSKKITALLLVTALCLALVAGCGGTGDPTASVPQTPEVQPSETPVASPAETPAQPLEEPSEVDYAKLLTEIPADANIDTIITLETRNSKHIQSLKVLFEAKSYSAYNKAVTKLKKDKTMEAATAAFEARANLVQDYSMDERIWPIWDGVTMPLVDGESFTEEELDGSQMFGYGFEPFAIKYLVEDQSTAKGNIIAVSGGAFLVWSNGSEGYPAAKVFNDLGYNYFLLQRRVGPYSEEDVFMDYQRFIRVVKHHAKLEGYGGQDMFAGLGWSGGGATIMGAVNYLYGDVLPTIYASGYVPDAIDAISADLDVVMPIYGGSLAANSGNTNLPAFYIAHGTADTTVPVQTSMDLYAAVKDQVPAELYLIEGAEHGFGVGVPPATGLVPGTELWPTQADAFMQANLGHSGN